MEHRSGPHDVNGGHARQHQSVQHHRQSIPAGDTAAPERSRSAGKRGVEHRRTAARLPERLFADLELRRAAGIAWGLLFDAHYWGSKSTALQVNWNINQLPDQYLALGSRLNDIETESVFWADHKRRSLAAATTSAAAVATAVSAIHVRYAGIHACGEFDV